MFNCRNGGRLVPGPWIILTGAVMSGCATQPPHAPRQLATAAAWSVVADDAAELAPTESAWWTRLNDHAIDTLAPAALADNPTLAHALARVDEADANLGVNAAQRLPALQASLGASRASRARCRPRARYSCQRQRCRRGRASGEKGLTMNFAAMRPAGSKARGVFVPRNRSRSIGGACMADYAFG